LAQQ
jgi:hypothetical protein